MVAERHDILKYLSYDLLAFINSGRRDDIILEKLSEDYTCRRVSKYLSEYQM